MSWLWIALGGAVGTAARYGLQKWMAATWGLEWPFGTMAANILGAFLIGIAMAWGEGRTLLGTDTRLVLGTGVLGGFTTYSSFNYETLRFAEQGAYARAALYMGGTLAVCLVAGVLGNVAARALR